MRVLCAARVRRGTRKLTVRMSVDNQISIARLGGVEAVLGALRRHETSASVAESACGAVQNLAMNGACAISSRDTCELTGHLSADNKVSIARLGGVEAVLGALRRHETSTAVAELACAALWNLAMNGACAAGSACS